MFFTSKLNKLINLNSPWGNDSGGGNRKPPNEKEIEEIIKKSGDKIKKIFDHKPSGNGGGFSISFLAIFLILTFVWLASGFYIVREGERAVVMRFGKYNRTAMPGPNYYLPTPFEKIIKLKVDQIQKEEIGERNKSFKARFNKANLVSVPMNAVHNDHSILMLTGDENIVDINFIVQWRISNIKDYVFNVEDPKNTLIDVSESAMREIIGETPVAAAHTEGKTIIQERVKNLAQEILDSYGAGVEIVHLQLLKVDPPMEVIDAYRDVQTARADKERSINEAYSYRNDILPRARGRAEKIVQTAEGYKASIISEAIGHASQFNSIYEQYRLAKNITKKRIYLETMEKILHKMDKIIIDGKNGSNVLPYLPLDKLSKK